MTAFPGQASHEGKVHLAGQEGVRPNRLPHLTQAGDSARGFARPGSAALSLPRLVSAAHNAQLPSSPRAQAILYAYFTEASVRAQVTRQLARSLRCVPFLSKIFQFSAQLFAALAVTNNR